MGSGEPERQAKLYLTREKSTCYFSRTGRHPRSSFNSLAFPSDTGGAEPMFIKSTGEGTITKQCK